MKSIKDRRFRFSYSFKICCFAFVVYSSGVRLCFCCLFVDVLVLLRSSNLSITDIVIIDIIIIVVVVVVVVLSLGM